jgi:hypothetical protein
MILVASHSIFSLFSTDEETFGNSLLWKHLLLRTCSTRLMRSAMQLPPKQIEIGITGKWYSRPKESSQAEWEHVQDTPGAVALEHAELYSLKVDRDVTDEGLKGLTEGVHWS